jgi:uncharacterized repeat protein (TIGR01451 family)
VTFVLTAKGVISGRTAQTTFTDGNYGTLFQLDGDASSTYPAAATGHDWSQVYSDFTNATVNASGTSAINFFTDSIGVAVPGYVGPALVEDTFSGGNSKDINDISAWTYGNSAPQNKADLEHAIGAAYIDPSNNNHTYLYVAADRYDNSGSVALGVWFLQTPIGQSGGKFYTLNPDGTPNTSSPAHHTDGDLLLVANFASGAATITSFKWSAATGTIPATGTVLSSTIGTAVVNTTALDGAAGHAPRVLWPYRSSGSGTASQSVQAGEFFEASVDLNLLFPGQTNFNFSSFVVETRASTSPTSTLSDFIVGHVSTAPDVRVTKVADSPTVNAGSQAGFTVTVSNVGVGDLANVTLTDPLPSGILWSIAPGGNLSGNFELAGAQGSQTLSLIPNLALASNSAPISVHIVGTTGGTGTLTNTATVAASNEAPAFSSNNQSTATIAIVAADVSVTKTDGVTTAVPGQSTTYTIVVSNSGSATATASNVAVSDLLPAGATSGTWSGNSHSGSLPLSDTIASLAAGVSVTYTVTVQISPSATGNLVNTATISGPNNISGSATDTDTLTQTADLSITKTDESPTYTPGVGLTYTIVAHNAGPSNVTDATVTDTFDAALGTPNWTATGTIGTSGFDASGTGNISDSGITIPANGSVTYTVVVTAVSASKTGNLVNTATVSTAATDPITTNNSATDTDTQASRADLQVTKTDNAGTYTPGTNVVYTVVVTNAGPSNVTGATVADPLPSGITTASYAAVAAGGATGFTASGSGAIADTVNLPAGSTITYTVTLAAPAGRTGDLANTATVTAPSGTTDPTPGNNTATDTDTQASRADLQVTKTDNAGTYTPGTNVVYTVVVTNAGPSNVTGATVADPLPSGITTASYAAVAAGGATGFTASGSGAIADTVNLPAGSTITYTVTLAAPAGRTGDLVNIATVTAPSGTTDPTPGNNTATDTDTPASSADVSIIKTDSPDPVVAGTNLTYTLTVHNQGPSNASSVTVTDALPTGTSFVSADGGGTNGAGTVTWSLGSMAPGADTILHLVVRVDTTAEISNTASVSSSTPDPNLANNSSTATTTAGKASPGISTAMRWTLNDSITIAGVQGGAPTPGSVTFSLYNNAYCSGDPVYTATVGATSVLPNTTANVTVNTTDGGYTTVTPGTYNWLVVYAGDDFNNGKTSACGVESTTVPGQAGPPGPSINALSSATGSVGTPATITGNGFGALQNSSTILFNGIPATVTSWSNTSIVVSVPGGGTGAVVVTVDGIQSNGVTFTVQ